jgi:hypothetical protein
MIGGNRRAGIVFVSMAVPAFVLAVLAKENAVTLPIFVLMYEYMFLRGQPRINGKRAAQVVAAGVLVVLIAWAIRPSAFSFLVDGYARREFTMDERVLTEFRIVVRYFTLILFPHPSRLNLDYNYDVSTGLLSPPETLLCLSLLVGALIYALLTSRKDPLISFCILWFLGNNVIESSVLPLELVFEHRMYLPSVGILIMVVVLLFRLVDRHTARLAVSEDTA